MMIPEEDRKCLNCEFFERHKSNPTYDGSCMIRMPPHIATNGPIGIRNADIQTCDLHRHLNRRI